MNFVSLDVINKAQFKLSTQNAADTSKTVLGKSYRWKHLWKSEVYSSTHIEKVVIRNGNVYYQTQDEPGKIHKINGLGGLMTAAEFYAPSYLYSTTLSYQKPQFLTLGEMIIKTEHKYKHYIVAEHFTKKIYFIASESLAKGDSLYAADISNGAKQVSAEKIKTDKDIKLTALVVDQLTGDIIVATQQTYLNGQHQLMIVALQSIPYLLGMKQYAGVSRRPEDTDKI